MCSNYFDSSVKTLIILWMLGSLIKLSSLVSTTTTLTACHGEAALVCNNTESAEDHRKALASAFGGNQKIDLVFIICNTTECAQVYSPVTTFIKSLVILVSTQYESYIDTDRLHISVIVYDNTSVRVTLNDIEQATPRVGNCEFDKYLNDRMDSVKARGDRYDGLLAESLDKANQVFGLSERRDAKKVLWLFSDCGYCETSDKRLGVEAAASAIKNGNGDDVVIFTVGITQCPVGWYATLVKENTMKTIATTNSGPHACIDEWIKFARIEINTGDYVQSCSQIINVGDINGSCSACASATNNSSYRCACETLSKQYQCHYWMKDNRCNPSEDPTHIPPLAIALGAGIGGGCLLFVIIIVIIVVVVVRRRKRPGPPPPPLPREGRISRTPPSPPDKPDRCPTYINSEATAETKIDAIEYEVLELERNMPAWADHLKQLKMERYPAIIHLGVYSVENDYFAQTAGFTFTESQKTALNDVMTSGNSGGNPRRTSDVTVGGVIYVIKRKTLDKLSAQTRDKKTILTVMCRSEYLVVGIAESGSSSLCDEVVRQILDAVTI